MSRSENIAVVESYLNGLARKDLSSVPFAPGITFEGPLMPKLAGRETIVGFLTSILPFIRGIEIKQHIVDDHPTRTRKFWCAQAWMSALAWMSKCSSAQTPPGARPFLCLDQYNAHLAQDSLSKKR